jgi:hypothetical protein
MNFYNYASDIVDYATLKKKPVVFLDFSFHEKRPTIEVNTVKKPHEDDYWWQQNHQDEYKEEKYAVSGTKPEWYEAWDYVEKHQICSDYGRKVEYILPGLPDHMQAILDEIKDYLKNNDLPVKTKYKDYDGMRETYFAEEHWCQKPFTSFVLYEILRVIEKKLGKEVSFTYPRGHDRECGCEKYVYSNYDFYHDKDGITVKVRVFFSDFSDPKIIYDMFLEELKTLKLTKAKFDQNIEINEPAIGKTKPRAPKKNIEPSQEEKLKIAQSALNDILENTSKDIISFLIKKNLLEEFKKSFIDECSKQSFAAISVSADIMFGDADGTHHDGFIMNFEEFNYIKEWWDEYVKVYPIEDSESDNIFSVGSDESGLGAWTIEAINKLLEDKTVKVFDFDNGNSIVKMEAFKDDKLKFENVYENITDAPDPNEFYNSLDDMLLAYASYWHTMGKKPEYLIELPTCF